MIPPKQQYTRQLPPAGTHIARVIGITYIGTVKGEFEGKPTESFKVRLTWELPNEMRVFKEGEPERPFAVSKEVSFSMGKKSTLRPIVEGIIGTTLSDEEAYGFNLDSIIEMPCLLSISHKTNDKGTFEVINSASQLLKGVTCPEQFNESSILSYDNWNEELFESLPTFLKEKIANTPEYKKLKSPNEFQELRDNHNQSISKESDVNPDDIPF